MFCHTLIEGVKAITCFNCKVFKSGCPTFHAVRADAKSSYVLGPTYFRSFLNIFSNILTALCRVYIIIPINVGPRKYEGVLLASATVNKICKIWKRAGLKLLNNFRLSSFKTYLIKCLFKLASIWKNIIK